MEKNHELKAYMCGDKVAEDEFRRPKYKKGECYTIFCKDIDGVLPRLINSIAKHGNGGHSFEIVVDKGSKDEESFFWDGDGSDRIDSIINSPDRGTDSLIGVLLKTLRSINIQARDALRTEPDLVKELRGEVDDKIDMKTVLENIVHDSNLVVSGSKWKDSERAMHISKLEAIKRNVESVESGNANADSALSLIKKLATEALEAKDSI